MKTNELKAQSKLNIARSGLNQIVVANPNSYSIFVSVDNAGQYIISQNSAIIIPFILSEKNIKNAKFSVSYNNYCYRRDSAICVNVSILETERASAFTNLMSAFHAFSRKETSFQNFLVILKLFSWVFGMDTPNLDKLITKLQNIWLSGQSLEVKYEEMEKAIQDAYDQRKDEISKDKNDCISKARRLVGVVKNSSFYASQFIRPQEKSSFQFTPFIITSYGVRNFEGSENINTILRTPFKYQPSYGFRMSYNFNAYDKHNKRKIGVRNYVPFNYSQSRMTYKLSPDSIYKSGKGFSFRSLSLGYGIEAIAKKGALLQDVGTIQIDGGIISGIIYEHTLDDSKKKTSTSSAASFKTFAPYVNVGVKLRVNNWLQLYGSWYSTIFYSSNTTKKQLPNFRQLNVGLDFTISRHFSYQY